MFEAVEQPMIRSTCQPLHDMVRVAPRLYMGAFPDAETLVRLRRTGFDAVAYCAWERDPPPPAQVPVGLHIIRCRLDDTEDADRVREMMSLAQAAAAQVAVQLRTGARVLVSCNMGVNRSGLVLTLALRAVVPKADMPSIIQQIRWARGDGALRNRGFERALLAVE